MQKLIVELIGTFFLVFTIGMVVVNPGGAGAMAPVAIAVILMAMIYAGGHRSGGHYNPAVTLGVLLRGKCSVAEAPGYIVAQLAGAAAASFAVLYLKSGAVIEAATLPMGPALLAEALFTFALVYVVLNAATAKGTAGNSFYGVAIGFVVLAGAYAVGPVSGGAFNPAVSLGVSMMGLAPWSAIGLYVAAQCAGAVIAAVIFRLTEADA